MTKKLRMGPSCYHVLHMVPPMVAHELDFFFDEGLHDDDGELTYELVPDSYAPFGYETMTLGRTLKERGIDITMDVKPSTIAHARMQGYDLYIIAGWRNQQPFYALGAPGVRSLADASGKRVGVIDDDDILMNLISYWLAQEGVDPKKSIDWVTKVDTRRGPGALREGRVDVAFVDAIDLPSMLEEGYTLLLDVMSKYPKGRPDRVIAATGRAIDDRPEDVKAFIKGMIRAYWLLRKQPESFLVMETVERRLRRASPDPDERVRMAQFGSAAHAERMPFPIDGLPTGVDQYLDEAASLGVFEGRVDPSSIARLDLAKAAFKELSSQESLQDDLRRAREVASRFGY